jgi:hypothetical protein
MNKYKSKLIDIKSQRNNGSQRIKHVLYFFGLIIFSYVLLIVTFLGISKLFVVTSTLDSVVNFYFFWSLLALIIIGFIFIIFKLIGYALEHLTISISGISKSRYLNSKIKRRLRFYWLVYSVFILSFFLIIFVQTLDNIIVQLILVFEVVVFSGLIGFSYHRSIISKLFWKVVLFLQIIEIIAAIILYINSPLSFYNFSFEYDVFRFIILCILIFIIIFIPLYGIWKYTFKSHDVWSK